MDLTHLHLDTDRAGVATVVIDRQGETMNTLDPGLMGDFAAVLDRIEGDAAIRAVVVTSAKPDNFVAGADIKWFGELDDPSAAADSIAAGQAMLDRLERVHTTLGKPVVAAIHGACLGGGLELALACSHRIATDDPKTKLGQPEVQLGLLPAAGGTQRLPELIGIAAALDLILTGRSVDARRARRLGLVDDVVPESILGDVAREVALAAPTGREAGLSLERVREVVLEGNPAGRALVFRQARAKLLAQTKGNLPAPERALAAVRIGLDDGRAAGLAAEARFFGELVTSPESRALRSVFFASRRTPATTAARPVATVGVVGGGLMGGGIATVSALRAASAVRLKEVDAAGVGRAIGYLAKVVSERVRRRRMSPFDADQALLRVTGTTDWTGFERADLVIEAVFEDLALKQQVLREVEAVVAPGTTFASNTSSLPIASIASAAARPEDVVGMHYFSPVEKMPLLEVVVTKSTSDAAEATAVAFGRRQGKTVIVVNDSPGFYTTRVLGPYTAEAFHLLAEGASVEDIDGAMEQWGFPVGPLRLADEVGLDVGAKISAVLVEGFGARMAGPELMAGLVSSDRKGRKNRRGFYAYDASGRRSGVDRTVYDDIGVTPTGAVARAEIQERISLAMINEAARCLDEGVLRAPEDGDIGAVMGIGFPPFRGGPFWWIGHVGRDVVAERLGRLADRHGERFDPAALFG